MTCAWAISPRAGSSVADCATLPGQPPLRHHGCASASRGARTMSKLRVQSFALSLDGYGAGPNQDLDHPLGVGGRALHEWAFATRTFQKMFGGDGGSTGIDEEFAAAGFVNIGAWILGRNMFLASRAS